jgi:hypothetical protein
MALLLFAYKMNIYLKHSTLNKNKIISLFRLNKFINYFLSKTESICDVAVVDDYSIAACLDVASRENSSR